MRPLTSSEQQLLDYLEMVLAFKRRTPPVKGYHYHGTEDFLLQHGQWFEVVPFPPRVYKGPPRHCYANAVALGITRGLRYIEGYGLNYIPAAHAWNVDEAGRLIDNTWMNEGSAYFGVEFSVKQAYRANQRGATMFEDWERKFPLFKKPWKGLPQKQRINESQATID